jgi:hypothetical protein
MSIGIGILGFAHGHVNFYCSEWQNHPEYEIKPVAGWDHDAGLLCLHPRGSAGTYRRRQHKTGLKVGLTI